MDSPVKIIKTYVVCACGKPRKNKIKRSKNKIKIKVLPCESCASAEWVFGERFLVVEKGENENL
jgi:translation initiation factor 2 beta subunit (eIF-2beta)/eIF-5